jgi:outer membrane protein insertion porin family
LSLIYGNLDNNQRPTRGQRAVANFDFAGLGGTTRYARGRLNAAKYWQLMPGFIFSATAEAGYIHGLNKRGPGKDSVLLTDRFFLGEPEIRGFDIRGVGPRVVRRLYGTDGVLLPIDDESTQDDALGGRAYYLGKLELEIPLGSSARGMGLRPSIFLDAGAVFGVTTPVLNSTPYPGGKLLEKRNAQGQPLFLQTVAVNASCAPTEQVEVTNAVNPNPPACLTSPANAPLGTQLPAFVEQFYGNTAKPRLAIGVGVNWNSPFGPFRIDFAYPLLKEPGDDTKRFSFNVGTQF